MTSCFMSSWIFSGYTLDLCILGNSFSLIFVCLHAGSYYFNGLDTQSDVEFLIPLHKLLKSSDFLVDDWCVVGAKILKVNAFSSENNGILVQKKATTVQNHGFIRGTYNLNIMNFPESNARDCICSPTDEFDGHKWYLWFS